MASVINTNMASLYAQKNLSGAQSALSTSVERLSSGLRINRAKDDAAGLGISEKLKSQIVALNQGVRNANDAVSMVQTAEGSLSEVSTILQRMKELAVQGRNESLSSIQRAYIADELVALKNEINSISERTSFNGMSLLKNALRTQVADAMGATNKMVEGASVISGVTVQNLKVEGANVGTYTLTTQTATEIDAVSNVSAAATGNALTARTVTINAGDVFEGAKLTVTINGQEYSAVAGQDSSAQSMASQLITKLNRDYENAVSRGTGANSNDIVFAANASLGNADISISMSSLEAAEQVENVRSTVDAPYDAAATQRLIKLNDFDIVEGRKVTISIGNPQQVAEFSTVIGAGATATSVANDLEELIDNHFSNVSASSGTITFTSSANLGMAEINLRFFETNAVASNLTISTVTDKDSAQVARTIEINENDLDGIGASGRVFSLMVGDKEYSYKATGSDTDETVAYNLSALIDDDYAIAAGAAQAPTVTTTTPAETNAITFTALSAGDAITVAGLTLTAKRNMTAAQVAERFANIEAGTTAAALEAETGRDDDDSSSSDLAVFTGTMTSYSTGPRSTATVTFTAADSGDVADLASPSISNAGAIADGAAGAVTPVVAEVTNGSGAGVYEVDTVTFNAGGIKANVGVTVAGLTFTAARDLTAAEAAEAFAGIAAGTTAATLNADGSRDGPGYGVYSGTFTAFTSSAYDSSTPTVITVTASAANVTTNVTTDIELLGSGAARDASTYAGYSAMTNTDGNLTSRESAAVAFNAATMKAGDSITVGGLRFTATSTVTQAQAAAAFANLYDGAISGDGTEYGVYSGQLRGFNSGTSDGTTVTFTSTAEAGKNVPNLTASADPVVLGVSRSTNTITLSAAGAKLGLEDVSLTVKDVADPGVFTLTANSDTGIAGTSQSVNVGSIAAGASKSLVFDQLGVSFSLTNSRSVEVTNDDFMVSTSKLDTLSVASDMNGEALFQVGAAVRDTVEINGFKDIRITGYNKNDSQAEREVFDNIHGTMTAIAGGDVDESTFATLETQIEEAITTVSTFRSYLGAQQNRIEYAISNIQAQSENLTEANSRIRDTDYAAETANLTKTQIMQQAATAMLAQANQMPNVILALLK